MNAVSRIIDKWNSAMYLLMTTECLNFAVCKKLIIIIIIITTLIAATIVLSDS